MTRRTRDGFAANRPGNILGTHIMTTLFLIVTAFSSSDAANNKLLVPENTGCSCSGSVLTFTCIAVGGGSTLWEGTAFDCVETDDSIRLRHSLFGSEGITGQCNNGAITGQSIGVENNCYTSQLNVTVDPTFDKKTVRCTHTSLIRTTIGETTLTVIEAPYSPTNNVSLDGVSKESLTFGWTFSVQDCRAIYYNISSDCGSCPRTTDATNATCSDLPLSSNPNLNCTFSVYPVVCGIAGEASNPITVTLKVPDAPEVKITPIYSNDDQELIKMSLIIVEEPKFKIVPGMLGRIESFQISVSGVTEPFYKPPCGDGNCEYIVDIPSTICQQQTVIYVTVSATNIFGVGPSSAQFSIGCTNEFVVVEYDSTASTITCVFLNQLDTSLKSCSIQYGQCSSEKMKTASANTTTNSATLNIEGSGTICYNVTASNGSNTVIVQGAIVGARSVSIVTIIVPVIIVIVIILAVCSIVIVLVAITIIKRRRPKQNEGPPYYPMVNTKLIAFADDDLEHLKLERVDKTKRWIELFDVDVDCSLKEFVEKKGLPFKRGHAFYEFTNSVESISEDKELIFMSNEIKKLRMPTISVDVLHAEKKLFGESVPKPSLKTHTLFVQSTSSGTRHLMCGSRLLYEHSASFWRVDRKQFEMKELRKDYTLKEWHYANDLEHIEHGIYIELSCVEKKEEILDVILQDKDTEQLCTGPKACFMAKMGDTDSLTEQWRVFVLVKYKEDIMLKKKQWILCQQEAENVALVHIESDQFETKKLNKDYELEEFQNKHNLDSGCSNVFVEVGRIDVRNREIRDAILIDKENGEFFTGPFAFNKIENIQNDNAMDISKLKWQAFALCDFEAKMTLSNNSSVLYPANKNQWQANGLMPIYSDGIACVEVKQGRKYDLKSFCKKRKLKSEDTDIFLECGCFQQDLFNTLGAGRDVILMDVKDDTKIYTGPYARRVFRQIQGSSNHQEQLQHFNEKWKLFMFCRNSQTFTCVKDSLVLFQNVKGTSQKFQVLTVDQDNIRMYQFIKEKLNSFEVGNAFYEFTQSEDFLYYKETVLLDLPKESDPEVHSEVHVQCLEKCCNFQSFYHIFGAPGMGLKPKTSKSGPRVFIQSTSQGARCLKRGDIVLYKKKE